MIEEIKKGTVVRRIPNPLGNRLYEIERIYNGRVHYKGIDSDSNGSADINFFKERFEIVETDRNIMTATIEQALWGFDPALGYEPYSKTKGQATLYINEDGDLLEPKSPEAVDIISILFDLPEDWETMSDGYDWESSDEYASMVIALADKYIREYPNHQPKLID